MQIFLKNVLKKGLAHIKTWIFVVSKISKNFIKFTNNSCFYFYKFSMKIFYVCIVLYSQVIKIVSSSQFLIKKKKTKKKKKEKTTALIFYSKVLKYFYLV